MLLLSCFEGYHGGHGLVPPVGIISRDCGEGNLKWLLALSRRGISLATFRGSAMSENAKP